MFVEVNLFGHAEPAFGFPPDLIVMLAFSSNLVLVDQREGQGQVLLAVGVEVVAVIRNVLAQLLLLELPNVQLLITVAKRVYLKRQFNPLLRKPA